MPEFCLFQSGVLMSSAKMVQSDSFNKLYTSSQMLKSL